MKTIGHAAFEPCWLEGTLLKFEVYGKKEHMKQIRLWLWIDTFCRILSGFIFLFGVVGERFSVS